MNEIIAGLVKTVKDGFVDLALLGVGLTAWAIVVEAILFFRRHRRKHLGLVLVLLAIGVQMTVIAQLVYDAPVIRLDFRTWLYTATLPVFSAGMLLYITDRPPHPASKEETE